MKSSKVESQLSPTIVPYLNKHRSTQLADKSIQLLQTTKGVVRDVDLPRLNGPQVDGRLSFIKRVIDVK